MPDGSPATDYSLALLEECIRQGVTDIVVCPGSRSQALALAAAALERSGEIRLHVRIDERVAGFFALGLSIETGNPAIVIVTSGTAVANLHPAVLEAHSSDVPLILITADRPLELRGIRSNQTTHQVGIFGEAARFARDIAAPTGAGGEPEGARAIARLAVDAALGSGRASAGPVHLNLPLREPLSRPIPDRVAGPPVERRADVATHDPAAAARITRPGILLDRSKRTVVIAGHGAGPQAEALAHAGGWPLIAEVSSGARFGRNVIVAYRELLADAELGGRVERAVVFGHPTLSRQVPALLSTDGVEVIVVAPTGTEVYNPGRRAAHVVGAASVVDGGVDRAWLGAWISASRAIVDAASTDVAPDLEAAHSHDPATRLAYVKTEFGAIRAPIDRRALALAVWGATWPHDRLVLGASRIIRDVDGAVPGKKISVHSNRGLAGIDGTVSTSLGIASASQHAGSGVTRVLLGDLTFLHDAGALLTAAGERMPRIQVIVGNDGGGTIFDGLEVAQAADRDAVDRVLYTPQSVNLEALATAYGWKYVKAATRSALDQALTAPTASGTLIEVPLER
ncbi:2-succinyl-5-enolpyruvyl-6-hydroxy-3-cyclohexene-1-carboxylic-acid synthase [Mycetocola zhujimingii]|uniref:2-succinyl-5-enolpyruvyl-6-hydroxy-3-cyclohexene-1-carboxylate synthase n=1 Tax=Mycetocola zhujimingii TaxID=2079792 RepID=A0A2U1TAB2_9MICO|nr:2-succinyl-5-enolpyruvyl-6-hydroxy-3-cyclohexene-1-carboxylic-acid synthase [Mycetocola zhujimingii]PWC04613.1 2-succinyl-5-enolpyruvyl-6-hydroxy-3-cyclohexene-1-carboxylic-acid synthase [Mycetocola zhujimingii]